MEIVVKEEICPHLLKVCSGSSPETTRGRFSLQVGSSRFSFLPALERLRVSLCVRHRRSR